MTKREQISATLKATKEKRKSQDCKVFEAKVDKSHLSKITLNQINRVFLEAKWLYNHTLSQENIFETSDKLKEVQVKVKDEFETREFLFLGSQMKQSVIEGLKQNIINLSKAKKKGKRVGALNFVSHYDSIDLKQFGNTYRIKGNRIRVQGISQWLRVRGLNQIKDYEIANGKFIQHAGDYYFHITCYKIKPEQIKKEKPFIGIDLGIAHQLTLSNSEEGIFVDYRHEFPKRLRKLYRRWSKKAKHSNNWRKQLHKINKEFSYWTNCKKDTQNKIFNLLDENFRVCFQNDNLRGWQRIWGRRMLSTGIGGITARLKKSATSVMVDRFFASTKTCSCCHHKQNVGLEERIFVCKECGYTAPRDFNSATDILQEGQKQIGVEYTQSTPVETEPLLAVLERLNAIPRLQASSVLETGSPVPLGMG